MNLEIETLQLELPVHDTKRALRIVDLIKEALARMPPLPVVGRDIRIAALVADDIRLIPEAPDAEIASAVVASISRALVQAINSAGGEARSAMGPVAETSDPDIDRSIGQSPAASPSGTGEQVSAADIAGPAGVAEAVRLGLSAPMRPLDAEARAALEPKLGRELGQVRVHEGPGARTAAAALHASAFTVGRDVVLGAGVRASKDDETLRHEVAHSVQQGFVDAQTSTTLRLTDPAGAAERDADAAARGARPSISSGPAVARDLLTYSKPHTDILPPIAQSTAVTSVTSAPAAAGVEAALAPLIAAGKVAKLVSGDQVSFSSRGATLTDVEAALVAANLPSAHDLAVGILDPHNMVLFTGERVTRLHSIVTIPVSTEKNVVERQDVRPLTAFERREIDKVFMGRIDLDKVSVAQDPIMGIGDYARTLPGTIYFPTGSFGSSGFMPWLIHEMTHIWQYTRGVGIATTTYHAIFSSYNYGGAAGLIAAAKAGKQFTKDFNTEQQGDILRDYYIALTSGQPTAPWDPFVKQMLAL